MTTTYVLRSNADTTGSPGVLIPDLGLYVPSGGGSESFTDDGNISEVNESILNGSLAVLTQDGAHVGGGDPSDHTIILAINGTDVPPGDADRAVNAVPLTIEEQDGTPSVVGVTKIKVANGTLTDEGDGVVSLAGGGGGGSGTVNEVTDGTTTVSNPDKIKVAETGTVSEPVAGTAQIAIRPAVDYAGQFEGTNVSTGDITNGKWGYFWRTTDSKMFLVRNRSNVLWAVEMNPL